MEELLNDDELREAIAEAEEIESRPTPEYDYTDPSRRGGPARVPEEIKLAAAVELTAARIVFDEMEDARFEAQLQLYEKVKECVEAGIPLAFIAEHSGLGHRSSVQRAVRQQLPRMQDRARRSAALRRGQEVER